MALAATALQAAPTFHHDIRPLLEQHCQVCHRAGQIGPMPLVTYADAKRWSKQIAEHTADRHMPPWFADPRFGHFSNDPSLTKDEIATFAAWASAGAPEGNAADTPPPRIWPSGWRIDAPDAVFRMPRPVAIPAKGTVEYTWEIVPTNFTQDKWVRMAEIRPKLPANVHHAVVYIRPPGSPWLRDRPVGTAFTSAEPGPADILLVYAPGSSPDQWPADFAKKIPHGADLVFQIHYTTNGRAASDQTEIGMVFAKEPPKRQVLTLQLTNSHFSIPPRDPSYRAEARGTIPNDALLLSFLPHLHLRGKQFEYNLIHRDGAGPPRIETLLCVDYHFHWQLSYRLAEPLPLKVGTELQAVAIWDNSARNPHNPDPDATVTWGDQTTDEMMVGFFDVAVDPAIAKTDFFKR